MAEGVTRPPHPELPRPPRWPLPLQSGYEASVYSRLDGKKIRRTFRQESEAKSWRAEAKRALDRGTLRAPAQTTLRDAAEAWLIGAETGAIRNHSGHSGHRYKPSTLRGYRHALDEQLLPVLGDKKLGAVSISDLQPLVDRWQEDGMPANTIRNHIKPMQVISRRARSREGLAINPTHDLELPASRTSEVEIVAPRIAAALLAAVPVDDRPVWATAFYAGLRYGELRALRWANLDFAKGTIKVTKSWDPVDGEIDPKSEKSKRTAPMPKLLAAYLSDHRRRRGDPEPGALVFGVSDDVPFQAEGLYRLADPAWKKAKLNGRLHKARHTFASFMIAAGVNAKALSVFMGHSSISVTYDIYGHLMPGAEAEGAALLDAFLDDQLD